MNVMIASQNSEMGAVSAETVTPTTSRWAHLRHLPSVMRKLGLGLLVVASFSFLFSGWRSFEPLERYHAFVGMTLVMALSGIFCVLRLQEAKSARAFLGLTTALLPIHFLQLGGMLLLDGATNGATLPQWLHMFQLKSLSTFHLWLTVAGSLILLPLVAYAGFSALARQQRNLLTLLYLSGNGLLLLPFRGADTVAALLIAGFVLIRVIDLRRLADNASIQHVEGAVCRWMLYVPLLMLALRNLMLFSIGPLLVAGVLAILSYLMFFELAKARAFGCRMGLFRVLSLIPALLAWALCYEEIFGIDSHAWVNQIVLPVSLFAYLMSTYTNGSGRVWRRVSGFVAVASSLWQLMAFPTPVASILSLLVAALVTLAAFVTRERGLLVSGVIGLVISSAYHLRNAVLIGDESRWIILSVLGIAIIIAGSVIERNSAKLVAYFNTAKRHLKDWE